MDSNIIISWNPLGKIKTIGHKMPDGWWYVYTPFDNDWHFVPNSDVTLN